MIEKIAQFFADVKQEMSKVSWPTKDELIGSTWVVVGFSAVLAVVLFFMDQFLTRTISLFLY